MCNQLEMLSVQKLCPCHWSLLKKSRKQFAKYFTFWWFSPQLFFSYQVSATFAASLVTSPAIGAYLSVAYGDTLVVILATAIALLDICFILVAVPESLPEKMRPASWGAPISWEQADPFAVSNHISQCFCTGDFQLTAYDKNVFYLLFSFCFFTVFIAFT